MIIHVGLSCFRQTSFPVFKLNHGITFITDN